VAAACAVSVFPVCPAGGASEGRRDRPFRPTAASASEVAPVQRCDVRSSEHERGRIVADELVEVLTDVRQDHRGEGDERGELPHARERGQSTSSPYRSLPVTAVTRVAREQPVRLRHRHRSDARFRQDTDAAVSSPRRPTLRPRSKLTGDRGNLRKTQAIGSRHR
jgi:hypothetical protein